MTLEGLFNHVDALLEETEQRELNQLRSDQINGTDWTPEKQTRLLELQKKADTVLEQRKAK